MFIYESQDRLVLFYNYTYNIRTFLNYYVDNNIVIPKIIHSLKQCLPRKSRIFKNIAFLILDNLIMIRNL